MQSIVVYENRCMLAVAMVLLPSLKGCVHAEHRGRGGHPRDSGHPGRRLCRCYDTAFCEPHVPASIAEPETCTAAQLGTTMARLCMCRYR